MIPQIQSTSEQLAIDIQSQPSRTYQDITTAISGMTDGQKAIIQTANHILNKGRYNYAIYPDWYGMELEKYKGQSFQYLEAQIEKDLSDALLQDDRIYSIIVTKIEQLDIDSAHVVFDMYTNEGTIQDMEVNINV